jgi:hypothetical protein
MEKKNYYFVLKTSRGNTLRSHTERALTYEEMLCYAKGVLFGVGARLKFCSVEVYDELGELIATEK